MRWNNMSMDSHQREQNKDKVYDWIKKYQLDGDEHVQTLIVQHYEGLEGFFTRVVRLAHSGI